MLETLNLADVKYIDELDDSDNREEEERQLQLQQRIKASRRLPATAVGYEAASSAVPAAVSCPAAAPGSLKLPYKTKPTIRTGYPQTKPLKLPRSGIRSTPPRTLPLQPCVERNAKLIQGASLARQPVTVQLPVVPTTSTRDLLEASPSRSQEFAKDSNVGAQQVNNQVGFNARAELESSCFAGHRFIPRHSDEVLLEMGDPIRMEEEYADLWCKGLNVRTGQKGIFPSVCLANSPADELEKVSTGVPMCCEMDKLGSSHTFLVRFLGSVEAKRSTGVEVIVDAIRKVTCHLVETLLKRSQSECCTSGPAPLCCLTVFSSGVQLSRFPCSPTTTDLYQEPLLGEEHYGSMNNSIIQPSEACHKGAITKHFFSLRNITYSGRHPENSRYIGFITKHPTQPRHACHCLAVQETDSDAASLIREIISRRLKASAGTPFMASNQALLQYI